jgi:hypothetical protein
MGGLGGEVIWPADFDHIAKVLMQAVQEKKVRTYVQWLGM